MKKTIEIVTRISRTKKNSFRVETIIEDKTVVVYLSEVKMFHHVKGMIASQVRKLKGVPDEQGTA